MDYHPKNQGIVDHTELEIIELKNIVTKTLDLSVLACTDEIQFTFPAGTTLSPYSFMVIASNRVEFENFYGLPLILYTREIFQTVTKK